MAREKTRARRRGENEVGKKRHMFIIRYDIGRVVGSGLRCGDLDSYGPWVIVFPKCFL